MYDKKKNFNVFSSYSKIRKTELNDFVLSFGVFIHRLLLFRGLELRHVSSGILPTTFCCA